MATARKTRPNGNSRADILKAAIKMFAQKPYDEVVIRDIAAMAKVQNPTIYHFFKSKNGLYREAVLTYYARKTAKSQVLPPPDAAPRTRIRAFVFEQLSALANDETFFQLLQRELLSTDEAFKKELAETLMAELYAHLDDILAGTRFGRGNVVIPTMIMSMILGYFQVARFQKYLPAYAGGDAMLEALADEITGLIEK